MKTNQVIAKINELASPLRRTRRIVDRVSKSRCIGPNRYRFDLFEKGKPIESVEVVCGFGRLSEIETEISDELSKNPVAA